MWAPVVAVVQRVLERVGERGAGGRAGRSTGSTRKFVGDDGDVGAGRDPLRGRRSEAVATGSPFRTGPLRTLADAEHLTMTYAHLEDEHHLHGELETSVRSGHDAAGLIA